MSNSVKAHASAKKNPERRSQATPKDRSQLSSIVALHPVLQLQRMVGNRAVEELIRSGALQPKLNISEPGDVYEQEADRVAESVTGMLDRSLPVQVRRAALQAQTEPASSEAVPDSVPSITVRGQGEPLQDSAREFFEPRLGYDLSRVRVHTDSQAAESANAVNALAFTIGKDIVFGTGEFAPVTNEGRILLAHELVHVVQQGVAVPLGRQSSRRVGPAVGAPSLQFDLARPVPTPNPVAGLLTAEQILSAIRFNQSRFADPYVFAVIRDVLGISRFPAVVDEEFVQAIAQWQAQNNLPSDGRLTPRTTATIVAELRAEGKLVPTLLRDAIRVELEPAFTFNDRLNFDRQTILILQGVVGAPPTGVWDDATIQRIMTFQRTNGLGVDGMMGPNTLRRLIETLIAASQFDDTIHVVVNAFHFPTANLAAITFDATVAGADAVTTGTIGTGQPQTVRVGPSAFTSGFEHMIRIIGHELQHVQQRSGATPIVNQHLREFLAFAWEALSTDSPRLAPAERVNHAQIAIHHWNQVPAADLAPHQAVRLRLDQLIAAGGVGNF